MLKLSISSILSLILCYSHIAYSFTLICNVECPSLQGWQGDELSIEFNDTNCPAGFSDELEEAFEVWNSVSTAKLKLVLGNRVTDNVAEVIARVETTPTAHNPTIICDPNFQTTLSLTADQANSILGVGLANISSGNALDTGYIILNAQSGAGGNIADSSSIQRKIVIAHELGHMLGIGHSQELSALMFFNIGTKENLNLHQDDADAYSFLYPRAEPQEDLLGCGLIKATSPPTPPPLAIWLLLLLPIALWIKLKTSELAVLRLTQVKSGNE